MECRLLIDNDALLKFSRYGLLETALQVFSCDISHVCVLHTAKYVLLPAKNRLLRCGDPVVADCLDTFLACSTQLAVNDTNSNLIDELIAVPNIDAGEALLLAACAEDKNTFLLTGDKRCISALASNASLAHVAERVAGRLVTLEMLLSDLIQHRFVETQERVRANPDVDRALTNAFGVSSPASFESVHEALGSYIRHLRDLTGNLLYLPSS